ncbi:SET domain-containing protein [Lentithecium fluviatile CBS 122367]|uniref:SET domain-containing protein n=1 Tax=Lentithecium fluviatile CBS 122367 TaxID=1168545 RepID=A0A6G1JPR5_9PLEO|nr:SET domain-containing protein [Lentithecium fluviatile CBS 122367]
MRREDHRSHSFCLHPRRWIYAGRLVLRRDRSETRFTWPIQLQKNHQPHQDPYTVELSPGLGLGAFATHDLATGSIILREAPVIRISRPSHLKGSGYPIAEVTRVVREEYTKLPPAAQDEVLSLTYHAKPGEVASLNNDPLGVIFRTNAYNTGDGFGLFPKIARINHSCRPNAGYYWSEALQKRIIYATREIAEGEEITVSYIPLTLPQSERQHRLNRYGFTCTCSACTLPPPSLALSDTRRRDIGTALSAFSTQLNLTISSSPSALRKARKNAKSSLELAKLVEGEGLADYLPEVCRIVAISHARVGDWGTASVWANRGFEGWVRVDQRGRETLEMFELTGRFVEMWKEQIRNETERG